MIFFKAYIGTLIAFLVLDALWLGVIMKNHYTSQLGHLMRESPNWAAAGVFYLFYVAGVVFLAVRPALATEGWQTAVLYGAVLGAMAYGTYDMTNYATLKDWPVSVVVADILWGTFLTAAAAFAGYTAARW